MKRDVVTSADVARAAGVSRATVSYVLNDTPGRTLTAATRDAVLRAAAELGYKPNAMAQSLKRGRSDTVLLPLPGIAFNHTLHTVFAECSAALAPHGLSLVLDVSHQPDPEAQAEAWARLAPAAVLDLVLHHDDPALARLRDRGVPVLSSTPRDETAWESTGDLFAREQRLAQVRHLLAQGHRRLLWLLPPASPDVLDPRSQRRLLAALRRQARASGGTVEAVELPDLDAVAGAVGAWRELPDAVLAHNDTWAVAALTALRERGLKVPDDVAVIGADDEPVALGVSPALTTVAGDFRGFAGAVAAAVDAVLSGRPPDALPVPEVRVVRRASA